MDYTLFGFNLVEDDSTLENFAKSFCKGIKIPEGKSIQDEEVKEDVLHTFWECITNDLRMTDINYETLMYRYRYEIGNLLYDMENHGYDPVWDTSSRAIYFFGEEARDSFEILLMRYIEIHYDELFPAQPSKGTVKVFTAKLNVDGYGDFIKCVDCEGLMLTELGAEKCSLCGSENLLWVDDDHKECCIEDLKHLGYKVELL